MAKKKFPKTVLVVEEEQDDDVVCLMVAELPGDLVGHTATAMAGEYEFKRTVRITNATTVEPVKPVKKKGKR